MQEIKTLIDKAAKICGSDKALADKLGIHPPTLSAMRKGRTITPETAAELADIAGESVKAAVYQAMLERSKGTRREGVLKEILGKSLLAGVAGMLLFSYATEAKAATMKVSNSINKLYIVEYWMRRFMGFFNRPIGF
jgi:transcriptional regulator with XRE-family HTH domain